MKIIYENKWQHTVAICPLGGKPTDHDPEIQMRDSKPVNISFLADFVTSVPSQFSIPSMWNERF